MISSHLFSLMLNCFLAAASIGTLKEVSGRARNDGFFRDRDQDMVSQHMSKLYEGYNREHRLKEGNTVRSFRAEQDSSDHRTVYRLNLTTLQDSEVVLSATFHFLLDGRPRHKSWSCKRFKSALCRSVVHASPSISLILRSISPESEVNSGPVGSILGNLTFHPQRRGVWQMKDVTQVIKEARNKGHLLVLVELDLMQQYQKKREETLSARSLPYLLLHANDQALAEPNSVAASLQRYDPFSERGEASQSTQLLHRDDSLPDLNGRVRREATPLADPIENNELPEVDYRPEGYRKDDLWESTWYLSLKLKPKTEKKEDKRTSWEEDMKLSRRTDDKKDRVVLKEREGASQQPKPHDSTVTFSDGRKHEGKDEGKDGKKHKGDTNSQSRVLSFDEQTMRKARRRQWSDNQHRGCSRRNLRVDFADIGWSEWVIAPKAFDAYYCAGTCGFPMPKVARPSNHATIQSIVRAVGIVPGIPEPCCVPEKMNPLAVLYQDESRNPVLKVYPNMSVQSCSCR